MVAPSPFTANIPPHLSLMSDFTDTFSSKICIGVTVSHSLLSTRLIFLFCREVCLDEGSSVSRQVRERA